MRRTFFVLVLLAVVLVSGCVNAPKDCGNDGSCFSEAVMSCTPAKIKMEKTQHFDDVRLIYTVSSEVLGSEGGLCSVGEKFDELELRGDITEAPSEFVGAIVMLADTKMICNLPEGVKPGLGLDETEEFLTYCNGSMKEPLGKLLQYKETGLWNFTKREVEILSPYCVGTKRTIFYIRNTGSENLNLTWDLELFDTEGDERVDVQWNDFSGSVALETLIPLKMAQGVIAGAEPGNHSYTLKLDGEKSYPFSVECVE